MDGSHALVTGASGFLGARLTRLLVTRGERVTAFVRAGADLSELADLPRDRLTIAVGEITCGHTVYRALAGCDRMYHVAAAVKLWDKRPARIAEPAVEGTRAALEAARQRKLRKVVLTSCSLTLGATREAVPIDETHAMNLDHPELYLQAKLDAEKLALGAAKSGLPVVIVNPAFVFGPGDHKPTPLGRMLTHYLSLPRHSTFRVPQTGGISIVDVDDVANGHLLAMGKGEPGERYILGGENVTTREVFEHILPDLTGYHPKLAFSSEGAAMLAARLMEVRARLGGGEPLLTRKLVHGNLFSYSWVSSEKARRELGYTHRPANAALGRAIDWLLEKGRIEAEAAERVRRSVA
jgi:dihydroflavonol-4-reductase